MTDEEKIKKEIYSIYEELKGVLTAIKEDGTWFDDNGFADHANEIIKRIPGVCPEIDNIDSYLIKGDYHDGRGGYIIHVIQTKAKLNSMIGRLKGLYNLEIKTKNEGNTFIQNQSQNQSQSLAVILELQEKIISEITKHKEGTKERNFLEKLKSALPTVKNMMDILSVALKIGSEMGLDPAKIHKLLGL